MSQRRLSEEHRRKIAAARRGRKHSQETREKIRATHVLRRLKVALFDSGGWPGSG